MKIKLFAVAALSAFTLLAACSDDNTKKDDGGKEEITKEFHVLTTSATPYSATLRVTPTTENASATAWTIQVFSKEMVEEFGGGSTETDEMLNLSAEGCALAMMEAIISQNANFTYEQIYNALTNNGNTKGTKTFILSEVGITKPGETCYALTVGLDKDLSFTTNAQFDAFTMESLPDVTPVECSFTFNANVADNGMGVMLEIQPEKGDVKWLANLVSKKDFEDFGGKEGFDGLLAVVIESMASQLKTTVIDAVAQNTHSGNGKVDFRLALTPESDYVAFVCAVDQYGRATSEVMFEEFTTPAFTPSQATISEVKVRLFDGNEIDLTEHPNLAGFAGFWFTFLSVDVTPDVDYWAAVSSTVDYINGEKWEAGRLVRAIINNSKLYTIETVGTGWGPFDPSELNTGEKVWGYAVGFTSDYDPGSVCQSEPFVMQISNKSPIDEFYEVMGEAKPSTVSLFSSVGLEDAPAVHHVSFVAAK